ncbi:MAG: prepilin peptidase [Chloroflexaceae bacterium]|nr:prepilin peptidase [Chloroflexaceae bacterium]
MLILVIVAGLLLGTLLNIIIIRLPRERNLLRWPLHCTRTGEALVWWQLLPVVGWLVQRGRSRDGRPLHWIHPVVELLTALVVTLLYLRYGFVASFFYLVFVCVVLIITGAIDWLHRSIYTFVILGSALLAMIGSLLLPPATLTLLEAGLGALIGGICFVLLFMLGRILFPSAAVPFGLGDVYLAIFIGSAVGITRLGPSLFYGILMAGIVSAVIVFAKYILRRRDMPQYIAYGTYMCLGTILYIVAWGL